MAILAIFTGNGIKKSDYENLRKDVGWELRQPKGLVIHSAAFDESVADVWESRPELDDYFNKRLLPAMKKLNITPSTGESYTLQNANVTSAADQFRKAA